MGTKPNLLQVVLPDVLDSLSPIEVIDPETGVCAALVERYEISELSVEWDTANAFYTLLSPLKDSRWAVRIGKIEGSFKEVLRNNPDFNENWTVAFLFKTVDTDTQLTVEELTYMEILLSEVFQTSANIEVFSSTAVNTDISNVDTAYMRHVLQSVLKILFLRGYRNSTMGNISKSLSETYQPSELLTSPQPVPALRKLQNWRAAKSNLMGKPEYIVGTNRELEDIVLMMPRTIEEFQNIPNLSPELYQTYASEIVDILNS